MAELKPAPWTLLPDLLDKLQEDRPHSYAICYTLQVFQSWCQDGTQVWGHLLTPDAAVDKYATCLLIIPKYRNNLVFHSLHPNVNYMKQLLIDCKHIDWSKRVTFGPIHERFFGIVQEITEEKGMKVSISEKINHSLIIDKEVAKELVYRVPKEVFIGELLDEHAELINSVWPHKDGTDSIDIIKQTVNHNGGIGVFLKDTNKLVSWALFGMYGGPGLLQTLPDHFRKGYGYVAAAAVTQYIAKKDIYPLANVIINNHASLSLFKRIGYQATHKMFWIEICRRTE